MTAMLIRNANIYINRGRFEEALLIEDGFVKAVGSNEEIAARAPADAEVFDAEGRTIVPGFNDSHQHLFNTGIALTDIRLHNATSIREVKEIPLFAGKAKLKSNHPEGSYEFVKDEDGNMTLKITDEKAFWSLGKYLVIEVG